MFGLQLCQYLAGDTILCVGVVLVLCRVVLAACVGSPGVRGSKVTSSHSVYCQHGIRLYTISTQTVCETLVPYQEEELT